MVHQKTHLMLYNKNSVKSYIPHTCGVYYLIGIADEKSLYPVQYIGNSKNIRMQLIKHCEDDQWPEVVFLNYQKCDTEKEAKEFAREQIGKHCPKYNKVRMRNNSFDPMYAFAQSYRFAK